MNRSTTLIIVMIIALGCSSGSSSKAEDTASGTDTSPETAPEDLGTDSAGEKDEPGNDGAEADLPPACPYDFNNLLPGPCQPGFDLELEKKAFNYDRQFHLFNAITFGVNTDVTIDLSATEDRAAIEEFLKSKKGWDFKGFAGKESIDTITTNHKVAGLYAGLGIVADAFRYATLRDQGYPQEEVDVARQQLKRALETLHIAQEITGVEGVIARGLGMKKWSENGGYEILPLFDGEGNPLPTVKNNGAWRGDNSGKHPDLIWEDSISRDMLIGWAAGMGAAWEVIKEDDSFDEAIKVRMKGNAKALAKALMVVRPSGYDLEVPDADGRTTLHGYLNEHNIDGTVYNKVIQNGFHAIMALGIVAAYAYVSEDQEVNDYLNEQLIKERDLPGICLNSMMLVDMGVGSNYSNYNMAFSGAWLAMRYVQDEAARATLRMAIKRELYDRPGKERQPSEIGYSYYDFVYSAAMANHSAWGPGTSAHDPDAVERGLKTLLDFAAPPYWDFGIVNCPDAVCDEENPKLENPNCVGIDGTEITLLGCVGRNGDLVADAPIPWKILGPSNFHWRSNPYKPNREGNGANLLPGVDFRTAYWIGRHVRLQQ